MEVNAKKKLLTFDRGCASALETRGQILQTSVSITTLYYFSSIALFCVWVGRLHATCKASLVFLHSFLSSFSQHVRCPKNLSNSKHQAF